MILEKNTFSNFTEICSQKRLVAFGATVFMQVIAENYRELDLGNKVEYVVDNDSPKDGLNYEICGLSKVIHSPKYLLKDDLSKIALLIGSDGYALEMLQQLQDIDELADVPCFFLPIMIMDRVDDTCEKIEWPKEARIPRIIHCFWFGDNEKDELALKCMESWRRFCPDYEIKEWNLNNYDVTKNPYMYEACKARKWAYVTDYARLDMLHEYGGFYFDMDLELTKSIDSLLGYKFVTGFGPIRDVELAAFGAAKGSDVVAKMLALYDNRKFEAGRTLTLRDVQPILMDSFMKGLGFEIDGRYQNRDGIAVLPRDSFSPRNWFTGEVEVLDSSFGIHHCAGSWVNRQAQVKRKESLKELRNIAKVSEAKLMIFGAGFYGKKALEQYGSERVDYFIDNDEGKAGSFYQGKEIISPGRAAKLCRSGGYKVVIASLYAESMAMQLEELGVKDYTFFISPVHGLYETDELVLNPYESTKEAESEAEWSKSQKLAYSRDEVNKMVEKLHENQPLFNHIEIETINRCNGTCAFCPVNKNVDPREKAVMSRDLFESIIGQLEEMQYSGRLSLFSNNEPLLDQRIIELSRFARQHLPKARIHMYTNGTLFTLDLFKELEPLLDELIIDNYNQNLELNKPSREIVDYCKAHPELELNKKVTIVLRKPMEILNTRGGDAPNRKEIVEYPDDRCMLPFKQMIVRPTGEVSLCCSDAIGRWTLGDLTKESILDVWYGTKFTKVREALYKGRQYCGNCKYCDSFSLG